MTPPTLDPNPKNQLGKGIFAPQHEAELLASGYVFACRLPPAQGTGRHKASGTLIVCKRFIADAVTDMELDDPRIPVARRRVASAQTNT